MSSGCCFSLSDDVTDSDKESVLRLTTHKAITHQYDCKPEVIDLPNSTITNETDVWWVDNSCPKTVKEAVEMVDEIGEYSPPFSRSTTPTPKDTETTATIILIVVAVIAFVLLVLWCLWYRRKILILRDQRRQAADLSLDLDMGTTEMFQDGDEGLHLMTQRRETSDAQPYGERSPSVSSPFRRKTNDHTLVPFSEQSPSSGSTDLEVDL